MASGAVATDIDIASSMLKRIVEINDVLDEMQ
jgi:hypothetical protein